MKNILKLSLLSIAMLCTATACNDNDLYYFDDSASERIEEAVSKYAFALDAVDLWVIEYFPCKDLENLENTSVNKYGGWIYVVEFRENNIVRAWFEGDTFVPADQNIYESEYRVEYSTGPMLKFDTHNSFLHYFVTPGYNGSGYQGYEGDHEFTIMSMSDSFDEIFLRGIKTGNMMRMSPLPGGYTPESYINEIRSAQQAITRTEFDIVVNGEKIGTISRDNTPIMSDFEKYASSKVWTLKYEYDTPAFDDAGQPILDENGQQTYTSVMAADRVCAISLPGNVMKLYKPYTFRRSLHGFADQTIQTFKWELGHTSAADCYVCTDSFLDVRFVP